MVGFGLLCFLDVLFWFFDWFICGCLVIGGFRFYLFLVCGRLFFVGWFWLYFVLWFGFEFCVCFVGYLLEFVVVLLLQLLFCWFGYVCPVVILFICLCFILLILGVCVWDLGLFGFACVMILYLICWVFCCVYF